MSNNSTITTIQYASAGCTIVSSLLSIFGAFVIFWTYWRINYVRNFPRTLLLWLTVADLLNASGNLVGTTDYISKNGRHDDICTAQSIVTTYASISSFLWTLVITAHMMASIQFRSNRTRSTVLNILYHVICWGIPGLVTLLACMQDALGSDSDTNTVTGTWCWIKSSNNTHTKTIEWMLVAGKGWEILCYILSLSILVLLKLKLYLSGRRLRDLNAGFRDEDTHFLYLWLLLWLLRVWGTIRFILFWSQKEDNLTFLIIPQSIGDSAQAFGNCILFCFLDKEVMQHIKNKCTSSRFEDVENERLIPTSEGSANNEKRVFYNTE
ncbi:hypothetical protein CHS0354_001930 [Potamilus streckersoni]|uniref:G-protein coupled receptors family 2 profile 2 domain-containing protein n=1 Tax=Potamilus streckersoni TaxID=2493646 RepID=A0AAE0W563_9BIVA|nr:hypothetical protein CHS0354_001930 [Potamilus streckersoni]